MNGLINTISDIRNHHILVVQSIFLMNVRLIATIMAKMLLSSKGSNGAIGFNCFHNSCNGHTWQDVRLLFEPDAYDKKFEPQYRQPNWKK